MTVPALKLYAVLEAVVGRSNLWRIGRWLYLGSRRELRNTPTLNGEYDLHDWVLRAFAATGGAERPWMVFCDVGANVGNWTANLLADLQATGVQDFVIHACEPAPPQFATLKARFPSDQNSVRFDPRGLAATSGRASFSVTGEQTGTSSLLAGEQDKNGAVSIEVTTLDRLCAEQGYDHLHLIKVDTEGNDFNVILGSKRMFERGAISAFQFEYNWRWIPFGHTLRDVFEFLEGRPFVLGKLTANGLEYYREWHPELDRFIETNYVIVHQDIARSLPHVFMAFDASNTPQVVSSRVGA